MKKRLIALMTVIACILVMTGCGSSQQAPDPDAVALTETEQEQWLEAGVMFTESMRDMSANGQALTAADDPVYGPAFESWETAMKDIGEVLNIAGESVEFTKDSGRISVLVDGSDHDAEVVLSLEPTQGSYDLTNVAVNVIYSFGELMEQAALNTVLGMGTTFAVLILLAFIILLFGKALNRPAKRVIVTEEAPRKAAPAPAPAVQQAAAEEENLTDNAALVAVITAAVAAYEAEAAAAAGTAKTDGFVVRSIRKARRKI